MLRRGCELPGHGSPASAASTGLTDARARGLAGSAGCWWRLWGRSAAATAPVADDDADDRRGAPPLRSTGRLYARTWRSSTTRRARYLRPGALPGHVRNSWCDGPLSIVVVRRELLSSLTDSPARGEGAAAGLVLWLGRSRTSISTWWVPRDRAAATQRLACRRWARLIAGGWRRCTSLRPRVRSSNVFCHISRRYTA